jgi:hypothetical protein
MARGNRRPHRQTGKIVESKLRDVSSVMGPRVTEDNASGSQRAAALVAAWAPR